VRKVYERCAQFARRLGEEPPFRLFVRVALKTLPVSIRTIDRWDIATRPEYLVGVLTAADQARRDHVPKICVAEFGVAGGNGLLELQKYAAAVENETGVEIAVYGFDTGTGLPVHCGDYRDHPDHWMPFDFPMDEGALRRRLMPRTSLIMGNVAETIPRFVAEIQQSPVGFFAVDVDLYSSAKKVLQLLVLPGKKMLRRVPIYFDDTDLIFNHKFAGELLAIDEFNGESESVKIDIWRGMGRTRVFSDASWLHNMYMAHDLEAITGFQANRVPSRRYAL
jgi:hypothetical protein